MAGKPLLQIVVAYSRNRVIGRDNGLPWRLPGDLAHFKRSTMGCPIIMGRKTWESLGRPLPGRLNVVVSRNADYAAEGATVCTSLEDALQACAHEERVCLIGGEQLFRLALPCTDEIIATEIHADIDGDTWFPALEAGEWEEIDRQPQPEENGLRYDFVTLRRK
ncbi:MAG TPA: dihydrofolate reductase [Burkholderiaceae bacterium]|nr:dihydrofolate reductase [Burkholderiaceae bacterium]